ncbi:DUF1963 domain-containing protein [Myroides odoratus]|uniref:DUF1963 domain-containing protein n=1 Tax=Myroides odoratus TaxID=256 RepID=UPI0007659917|nr:DUF1963 domain-containing protein [Myroides odoratus]
MYDKTIDIIRFEAAKQQYFPVSLGKQNWMKARDVPHTELEIPLGHSRYGGPVIDLPPGVEHPEGLRFAGQLDLAQFAPFDPYGLLPKTGQLLFFVDIMTDEGQVIYADVKNEDLVRIVVEHEDNFFYGVLIDRIYADVDQWSDRYYLPEEDYEEEDADEEGYYWDYFGGTLRSKIFGFFTHCQLGKEEIEEVMESDKIVLFQVGENEFNDEGVFSVLINKEDLKNRNFDRCSFYWAQS